MLFRLLTLIITIYPLTDLFKVMIKNIGRFTVRELNAELNQALA